MKLFSLKVSLLTIVGCAVALPQLSASIIGPGGTAAPDVFTTQVGYTQLANTGLVTVNPTPGTSFKAQYVEYVGRDINNNLCGVAGQCLTFLIDLWNMGPGVIERVSTGGFTGYVTDVGINTDTGFTGITPATVDRSANGNVVGFNFNTGSTNINAGQRAVRLEIMTNAVLFVPSTVSVQDGVADFGAGFAPAVPEPGSMVLFGAGLVGLGFVRKFRRANC